MKMRVLVYEVVYFIRRMKRAFIGVGVAGFGRTTIPLRLASWSSLLTESTCVEAAIQGQPNHFGGLKRTFKYN